MTCHHKIVGILLIFSFALLSNAQTTLKSQPISWASTTELASIKDLPEVDFEIPDIEKAKREDENGVQDRFAIPVKLPNSSHISGKWETTAEGFQVWRIKISAKQAKGWILCLDNLNLPAKANLYAYSSNKRNLKGAYTSTNNNNKKKLTIGPIVGDDIVIEYNLPATSLQIIPFDFSKLYLIYKENPNVPGLEQTLLGDAAYNSSLPCMVNVNCPEGDAYQMQKNSVVRILIASDKGFYYCTGSLMNNTKKDSTPYVLSGFHCEHDLIPNYDNYIFVFGWETPSCQLPNIEPSYQTMDGCSLISKREESDFVLYKLNTKIPFVINAYFNGWNKSDNKIPSKTAMIHHPNGDVKKISIDNDPAVIWNSSINWMNGIITPGKHHWRVSLDKGASMGGSSGAPLFDEDKRVVGQLNGGNSNCMLSTLFYGRLSKSWADGTTPATRLKEWLDPLNLGLDTLSGLEVKATPVVVIAGRITNSKIVPIKNVMVVLSGYVNDTVFTGTDGRYKFDYLPLGKNYSITPIYDTYALDGISTGDIGVINKHVLGVQLIKSEFKKLAADVNRSSTISTADINIINKMVLGKQYEFPSGKNWYFVTPNYKWPLLAGKADTVSFQNIQIDQFDVDFIGVKLGDVTGAN